MHMKSDLLDKQLVILLGLLGTVLRWLQYNDASGETAQQLNQPLALPLRYACGSAPPLVM
jgi:hypothetical protein